MDRKLPEGAKPGCIGKTINPYDKRKRDKGLNFQEDAEFSGICSLASWQLIDCYAFEDRDIAREEFITRCKECPYAKNAVRRVDYLHTNRYPNFILDYDDVEFENPKSYVYFITDAEFVKIGVAVDPAKRMEDLQVASARELTMICKIPARTTKGAYRIENFLHWEYKAFLVRGEWYDLLKHIKPDEFRNTFPV